MRLQGPRDHYLMLFADCVPVSGARRCAIYDLTRHEIHLFPGEFYPLLQWLNNRKVGDVLDALGSADGGPADDFVDFLIDNELAMTTADPSRFPPLSTEWDFPGDISNAIVDVDRVDHDFTDIITQLDELGCQFLQVRGFSPQLSLQRCGHVAQLAGNTSVDSIEFIVHHDPLLATDVYRDFLRGNPIVTALTVHSVPRDSALPPPLTWEPGEGVRGNLTFTHQVIDSERHCGVITQRYLSAPTVASYSEFRSFNGCLNRKIAVDTAGRIRNCPSMAASFGSVGERRLDAVVSDARFREPWQLRKDEIAVCRDCEFRYVCSDCRAYVEDPADSRSKPLKCGYDPTTATWAEWHGPNFKWPVIETYGIPTPPVAEPL